MRALIQRTKQSSLYVDDKLISSIPFGLTVFLGVEKGDSEEQADYLARKLANLRIFRDENGKMNLSVKQVGGEILLVSQFSLAGKLGKGSGNRPDFGNAELPDRITVKNGVFGAHMFIEQQQDGPLSFVFEC